MGIEKVIESYRKSLELVKDGIGEIDTESEHGKCFITEAQKVLGTLIENLPNVQKIYEEMEKNLRSKKTARMMPISSYWKAAISTVTVTGISKKRKASCKPRLKSFGLTT